MSQTSQLPGLSHSLFASKPSGAPFPSLEIVFLSLLFELLLHTFIKEYHLHFASGNVFWGIQAKPGTTWQVIKNITLNTIAIK